MPLEPVLVVEVSADHITGEHMRHGARLLRWRTDKPPESCTMDRSGEVPSVGNALRRRRRGRALALR